MENFDCYKDLSEMDLMELGEVMCVIDKQNIAEMDFERVKKIIDKAEMQKAYNVVTSLFFLPRRKSVKSFLKYVVNMVNKYPEILFYSAGKKEGSHDGIYVRNCNALVMYCPFIRYIYKRFHHLVPDASPYGTIKEKVKQTLLSAGYNFFESEAFFNVYMNEKDVRENDYEETLKKLFPSYSKKIK